MKKLILATSVGFLMGPLSIFANQVMSGSVSIEDARNNITYPVEKEVKGTDQTGGACFWAKNIYGENYSPNSKKIEVNNYTCPTEIMIRWRVVDGAWITRYFTSSGNGQLCNIVIRLVDGPNPQWPDNVYMSATSGCSFRNG